jgi:hypothetical protein
MHRLNSDVEVRRQRVQDICNELTSLIAHSREQRAVINQLLAELRSIAGVSDSQAFSQASLQRATVQVGRTGDAELDAYRAAQRLG